MPDSGFRGFVDSVQRARARLRQGRAACAAERPASKAGLVRSSREPSSAKLEEIAMRIAHGE